MSYVFHSYVLVCHPYVTRMSLVWHPYVTCISSVCYSYVFICHWYVTRIYSYVIRMSLVYNRMPSVSHLYVLVCHSYVLVCHPYVTRLWFYHEPNISNCFVKWINFLFCTQTGKILSPSKIVNLHFSIKKLMHFKKKILKMFQQMKEKKKNKFSHISVLNYVRFRRDSSKNRKKLRILSNVRSNLVIINWIMLN